MSSVTEVLVSGLAFPEGPRWHDGAFWFSDMHADTVFRLSAQGELETVVQLDGDQPSGLGWRPNGDLMIVSMTRKQLLAFDGSDCRLVADLAALATGICNDMVVDNLGRCYIGNFGFDLHSGAPFQAAELILVDVDNTARVVADNLAFPNGTVLFPDSRTLVVGESAGRCLTAFDVNDDGSLENRRLWAKPEGIVPDGICLDDAGGIWVASPNSEGVVRVEASGRVTHRVPVETEAFACMLGGDDGRTLYIATAADSHPEHARANRSGRIEMTRAPFARAGLP